MKTIPLRAVPSQTLQVVLSGQNCRINVYQKSTGLFLDLFVSDVPIVRAVRVLDRVRIVRSGYQGFVGDLAFRDTHGASSPSYQGLGDRFQLVHLETADL